MNRDEKVNPKPNIILITTDQQRYDTVGPDRPDFLRTPHYDHLCRDGITFTKAYADCPLCVPARTSIMTGKYGLNHGLLTNGQTSSVMGHTETLPAALRAEGYQTAAIGKMHFGPERVRHGFEEMILPADYYNEMAGKGHPLQPMRHGLGQNELYPTMATVPESMTLTSWIAEKSLEYIQQRRDPSRPYFLWCSFSKPHPPLDPPEPYYSMYLDENIPAPISAEWAQDANCPVEFMRLRQRFSYDLVPGCIIKKARAAYYGLITQVDYNMGRIFAALQDKGEFDNTLIIYTSDHGEYLGDFKTGAKLYPHEPSAHVPFVIKLPKSRPGRISGETIDSLVTHADIMPTLLNAAGGKPGDKTDGIDLIDLACGNVAPRHSLVFSTAGRDENEKQFLRFLAITDGRWKYIYFPEGPAEQLFDLESDPKEKTNLASQQQHHKTKNRLKECLIKQEHVKPHLANGLLPQFAVKNDTETERRSNPLPGYCTEFYDLDIKH